MDDDAANTSRAQPMIVGYGTREPIRQRLKRLIPRIGPVAWVLLLLAILMGAWFWENAPVWGWADVGRVSPFWNDGKVLLTPSVDGRYVYVKWAVGHYILDMETRKLLSDADATRLHWMPDRLERDFDEGDPSSSEADRGCPSVRYPNGTTIAYVDDVRLELHIRDLVRGSDRIAPIAWPALANSLKLAANGSRLILARSNEVLALDPADGHLIARAQVDLSNTRQAINSPDGRWLIFHPVAHPFPGPGHVFIFDSRTLRQIAQLDGSLPNGNPFSPDSRCLVIANEWRLSIINLEAGDRRGDISDEAVSCAWSPDGSLLTIKWNGEVRRWKPRRPEAWWGVAELLPFWVALVAVIACVWRWGIELRRWYWPSAKR